MKATVRHRSDDKPTGRGRRWPKSLQLLLALSFILPALSLSFAGWWSFQLSLKTARDNVATMADLLHEYCLRTIDAQMLVVRVLKSETDSLDDATLKASASLYRSVLDMMGKFPQVDALYVIDHAGSMLLNTRQFPPPDLSFTDRDYFQAQQADDAPPFVSRRYQARLADHDIFNITLGRSGASSGFNGVLGAAISIDHFEGFFAQIAKERSALVTLVRTDGTILASYPDQADSPDSADLLIAQRSLTGYPLIVSYALRRAQVIEEWWRGFVPMIGLAGGACIGLVLTSIAILRSRFRLEQREANLQGEIQRRSDAEIALLQRELALIETQGQLDTVMAHTVDGLIMIDQNGIVLTFSKPAEQIFGYQAVELIGYPLTRLLPVVEGAAQEFSRRLAADTPQLPGIGSGIARELQGRRKNGSLFPIDFAVNEIPVLSGTRRFVVTIRDITQRKLTEQQLHQAQKMDAIGKLTGGLAHDFNNLLGVVLGSLGELTSLVAPGSDAHGLAEAAIEAAWRGADLNRQLLAFARRQPLAPKVTDIPSVLQGLAELLRRAIGETIVLELNEAETWPTLIDVAQLESAMLNLAVNARDAMPNGGCLTIEAKNVTLDAGDAELNTEAIPGNYVVIAVSDTGIGMHPDVAARVFEPFFTTKGSKGSGLGLSMVHGFVKQSGGHTRIYSEPGCGTTVRIYLPRTEAAPSVVSAPDIAGRQDGGNEVILVVEDNSALRSIVLRQLKTFGYRTIPADNGAQALAIIRGSSPIDLLFTDVVMPGGIDGHALAEEASRLRPGLKILLTSGFTAAAASAALDSGIGFSLLSKPYRKEDLAHRIRMVLDGQDE